MALLQDKMGKLIPAYRDEVKALVKEHGDKVISEVTIAQAYGGARGVKMMICDTSEVNTEKGLIIRGRSILDLVDKLPEEIFWLLLTGEEPSADELKDFQADLQKRQKLPDYVLGVLKALPKDLHPMAMVSAGICAMQRESKFAAGYAKGMNKTEYWGPMLEDAIDLVARIPVLAAYVYRIKYNNGDIIEPTDGLDMGANYAKMLGVPDPNGDFAKLMQLYLTLHCDHEGGNVSANTAHTVGSALSDAYYSVAAGLNGLAGPLHGLANQECLKFVLEMVDSVGGRLPTDDEIKDYTWKTLNEGKVIPGYGHAVLRCPDPRFVAFLDFGKKYAQGDPVYETVAKIFEVVPGVLKEHGKAKNPQPNVDAGSGSLLYHFNLKEFEYYTVLFLVSRAMGMLSQLVLNRGLGTAITRPKSVTTRWVKEFVKG